MQVKAGKELHSTTGLADLRRRMVS